MSNDHDLRNSLSQAYSGQAKGTLPADFGGRVLRAVEAERSRRTRSDRLWLVLYLVVAVPISVWSLAAVEWQSVSSTLALCVLSVGITVLGLAALWLTRLAGVLVVLRSAGEELDHLNNGAHK